MERNRQHDCDHDHEEALANQEDAVVIATLHAAEAAYMLAALQGEAPSVF